MPNLHFQIHSVFISMTSRVLIWDFRLRISDLWNRFAQSFLFAVENRSHSTSEFKVLLSGAG
jgi:hypothetical protein